VDAVSKKPVLPDGDGRFQSTSLQRGVRYELDLGEALLPMRLPPKMAFAPEMRLPLSQWEVTAT
jgi:hypothetical protein